MKKVISGGIFGLLGLAFPIYSHAITLEGSIGAVELSPSGYINYHSSGVSDNVDIKNDLGFSSKVEPNLRLKINTDEIPILPNFEFSYLPVKFSGYTTNQNIVYDGYTFNGNLSSSLKADHYDIFAYYHPPFIRVLSKNVINGKIGIGARILDIKAVVTGTATSVNGVSIPPQSKTVSKSITAPVPMVYLGAEVRPVKYISGDLDFKGITYGNNYLYSIRAEAKLYPINHVFVGAGYRYEELKIDVSSLKSDFKVDGPFAEMGVYF